MTISSIPNYSGAIYLDGYIVLKDGWRLPCDNVKYYIEEGYLSKRDSLAENSCEYVINNTNAQCYIFTSYHINLFKVKGVSTDFYYDPNPCYSIFVLLDLSKERWKDFLKWGYYPYPFWKKTLKMNRSYIPFQYQLSGLNTHLNYRDLLVYKSDCLQGVFLVYEKDAFFPDLVLQYPALFFCDTLQNLQFIEKTPNGSIYKIHSHKLNGLGFRKDKILWKDDKYLSAVVKKNTRPNITPQLISSCLDSAILQSNRELADYWKCKKD